MRPGEVPAAPTHTIKRWRARQERQRVKRASQQLPQQRLSPTVHMRSSGICGVYLLRAEESCFFGPKYSAYLVTVEQGDQLVGHAKLPTFQCWRYHGFNSFKLLRWISPQIDFGRLNIIMSQPQRHLPDIPCGL